eukprot:sb/3474854/
MYSCVLWCRPLPVPLAVSCTPARIFVGETDAVLQTTAYREKGSSLCSIISYSFVSDGIPLMKRHSVRDNSTDVDNHFRILWSALDISILIYPHRLSKLYDQEITGSTTDYSLQREYRERFITVLHYQLEFCE